MTEPDVLRSVKLLKVNVPPAPILLIDGDAAFGATLQPLFAQRGFQLDAEHDAVRGLAAASEGRYQLVVLDLALPRIDGLHVMRRLRRHGDVPIIVVTARAAIEDRILAFDAGADDFVAKPAEPEELLVRIRAVLRRAARAAAPGLDGFTAGGLEFHPSTRRVLSGGTPMELTSIEYDILECLARSAGRVLSRDTLIGLLHQRDAAPFDRSVDVHVHHVRRKLGKRRKLIRTVRGEGYVFCRELNKT
jgi:two-component system response regulator CpxR